MEKRIKTLYIITIIAILSFLAMQVYWLYVRYEFSLREYENKLDTKVRECVDKYNAIRVTASDNYIDSLKDKKNGFDSFTIPTFSLSQHYGDTVKTTRKAKILTYIFSAHELLGLKPGTPLTTEQKNRAMDLAQKQMEAPADSVVFDASGATDENEAWTATRNVQMERNNPFTIEGIDSILTGAGIKAWINLKKSESMVWVPKVVYHKSVFKPALSITIPYSQLEGKTVNITCGINPFDILPGMWQTLLITFVVSTLLIVCLVLQFSTVLKLSRIDKMRNGFITTMIHELKRPISTLKMCVSGLNNEKMVGEQGIRKELLAETRNALDNLSAYFSKLRDIMFNNVEQIPLNIRSVNLHDLFDSVASAIAIPADKSVVIKNNIPGDVIISADGTHLYNILNNLVENGVKYSGRSVVINAYAVENNDTVEFQIGDTGNGISSGDLKHIFKRFYRGKASVGDQPGMGLGLAYVKLLVEALGGTISVESKEGDGTCFTIKLPQ
jgi:hypothetical protein